MKKYSRRALYVLLILAAILIYYSLASRFDEDKVMKSDQNEFLLSDLTNFKWDYAELFVKLEGFSKIDFYKNDKLILEHKYRFEPETVSPPQIYFSLTPEDKGAHDIVLYKCGHSGRIRFSYEKYNNKYYYPVDCELVTENVYMNQLADRVAKLRGDFDD